jgi:hypothetical protein
MNVIYVKHYKDRAKLLARILKKLLTETELYLVAVGQEIPRLLDVIEILEYYFGISYELMLSRENGKIKVIVTLTEWKKDDSQAVD